MKNMKWAEDFMEIIYLILDCNGQNKETGSAKGNMPFMQRENSLYEGYSY